MRTLRSTTTNKVLALHPFLATQPQEMMFDYNTLADFSRINCISICAFLVPANLVATTVTIVLTALRRPLAQVLLAAGIATIPALVMIMHVFTWLAIGVVMVPTYILLWLGTSCMLTNVAAIYFSLRQGVGQYKVARSE